MKFLNKHIKVRSSIFLIASLLSLSACDASSQKVFTDAIKNLPANGSLEDEPVEIKRGSKATI